MTTLLAAAAAEGSGEVLQLMETTSGIVGLAWLIPVLPLLGFVLTMAVGKRLGHSSHVIALAASAASFVLSIGVLAELVGLPVAERRLLVPTFDWLDVGGLQVTFDILVDPLTAVMLLVVTGVGTLVHLYSIGYMHDDAGYTQFFALLNLFLFSMLVLVLGSSFLMLFVGWELVGLSSYLLIGFWFHNPTYAAAAKKAFITNRVGDVAFMTAMFLIFNKFGSLDFFGEHGVLTDPSHVIDSGTAMWIGLLLTGGAVAKSAQIPLYVWLPDAMAGPTPVSALMHAATMVTAGVFLIARSSAIIVMSQGLMVTIATIGAFTALGAALIACRQDDIKKILAYSTVSQLGYMFIGVGSGGFSEGIFHLVTHAFFKGLLFLAAGSVMHAFLNRTNMWKMGGLRKAMPITFFTSAIAWIAISGIPPFAGFWSKDQILTVAYEHGFVLQYGIGLFTALLTAFYMSRWFFITFMGDDSRWEEDVHPHESPGTMTLPLMVLAVLSAVGGLMNIDHTGGPFYSFLTPAVAKYTGPVNHDVNVTMLIVLSVVVAALGIFIAWAMYLRRRPTEDPLLALAGISTLLENKFYVDELYELIFVKAGTKVADGLAWFDRTVIDGAVNGAGAIATSASRFTRRAQTGSVRNYLGGVVFGTVVVVAALIVQAV